MTKKNVVMKYVRAGLFICLIIGINALLKMAFVQVGLTRVIFHELEDSEAGYDCVIYGQSHTSYGVDPLNVGETSGMEVMNAGIGGARMMDIYYMMKDMYDNYTPDMVVLDMDYQYFLNVDMSDISISNTLVYYNYPDTFNKIAYSAATLPKKDYRAALFQWMNYRDGIYNMRDNIGRKLTDEYKNCQPEAVNAIESCDTYKTRGFLYRDHSFVRDENARVSVIWDDELVDTDYSTKYFQKIVNLCKDKGSQLVIITSPINRETILLDETSMGNYQKAHDYIGKMAADEGLKYYDFNYVKSSVYAVDTSDYWDYDGHMYGDAASRYSRFLGEFLKEMEGMNQSELSDYFYENVYEL